MFRALLKILFLFGLTGLILVGIIVWDFQRFLDRPVNVQQNQYFSVSAGSSFGHVSNKLVAEDIFPWPHHAEYFSIFARLNQRTAELRTGEYEVRPGMNPRNLLDLLTSGKGIQHSVTIIEGWTFAQMMAEIAENQALRHTLKNHRPEEVMRAIGHEGEHPEGRFFPDTYLFPRGMTDVEFLKRAYNTMADLLEAEWKGRAADISVKDPYEALILASIVEKETAVSSERFQVAGVFDRRLKKGMLLQTDPTVIYGMGDKYKGDIRFKDLREKTPYNTYVISGLPPTPICLPGKKALNAALHPADGDALYFVSKGDGSHVFSSNLKDHNAAVRKYQLKK